MLIKKPQIFKNVDLVWSKVLFFSGILFFVFFADAVLSFWAPNLIEEKLGSSKMGLIIAFSSVVGLLVDLLLPSVLAGVSAKKLLVLSVFSSVVFSTLLILGAISPLVIIFLLSMAVWGLYYEFIIFATQLFVAGNVGFRLHSGAWAIIGIFKNFAYLLGPIASGFLLDIGNIYPGLLAIGSVFLGFLGILLLKGKRHESLEVDYKNINILSEIIKWKTLFIRVWPVIVISLVLGIIDSVFWISGSVYTEKLTEINPLGRFFLSMYQVPSLFVGFIIIKWGIFSGKKKLAEIFMLMSGLILTFFSVDGGVHFMLLLVFMSSLFLAFTYPLIEGVYSDVVDRMGREKKHLIGFSSAAVSVAYIIGPIIAGFAGEYFGEKMVFSYLGIFVVFVSVILLFTTPKKLKLPQEEIKLWM